jgi:hypothetical protein
VIGSVTHSWLKIFTIILLLIADLASLTLASVALADEPFNLRDHLTLSASDRVRGEFVSWFDPGGPQSDNTYNFFANRLRAGISLGFPTIEFVVEGQDTRMVNLPGADSINSGTGTKGLGPLGPGALYFANTRSRDQGETFLHLGYATIRNFGLPGVSARVGRFGYNSGLEKPPQDPTLNWLQRERISQRLIGNFDYTNVGRSFDGVEVMYDQGPGNVTLMASHPTFGGFNVNANKEIDRIDLVSGTATLTEPAGYAPLNAQFFYVYYGDRRHFGTQAGGVLDAADNRPAKLPAGQLCSTGNNSSLIRSCDTHDLAISTVGADVTHVVEVGPGKADVLAWAAGQFGDWQSLDQAAWAYAFEGGYQLHRFVWDPWLRLGFFRSSGDDKPGGDTHETFFQLIPTSRIYALFPFYNLMNNQDLFVQAMVKPLQGLSVMLDGHWLRATNSGDLWYAGGGATSSDNFGYSGINANGRHELSYLTDLALTYSFNRHMSVYGFYGHAFGQGVVSSNFAGNNADYGYIETTVAF